MSKTVIGIFENENEAQRAVQSLVTQGFDRNDVDIASRTTTETRSTRDDDDEGFGSSISDFFSSLFGNDDENATRYSEVAKRGCTVVVHALSDSDAERAADMLDEYGAVDIDEKASQYRNDLSNSEYNRNDTTTAGSIPIIEENLEIGKKEVETGGARIRSRIVEKPVEENVRLRSEHVNVQRKPVNREATDADFNAFEEGTVEMTEHKEVPVVGKKAWVKEEISLNKEVEETDETVRDTVRNTEVDIENLNEDQRIRNSNSYTRNENDLDDEDDSFKKDRDYDL